MIKDLAPDYGMYSVQGNLSVDAIVEEARAKNLSWPEAYTMLESNCSVFGESMEMVVLGNVYHTLGFSTDFFFFL
jgi:hypothetical protein